MKRIDFLKTLGVGGMASLLPSEVQAEVKANGGDAGVVSIKPNDLVVLMFPNDVTPDNADRLNQVWKENMPGVRCLVLGNGAQLGVLRVSDGTEVPE